jgi:hypothetical protein
MEVKNIIESLKADIKNSYLEVVEKGVTFSGKKYCLDGLYWTKEKYCLDGLYWTKETFSAVLQNAKESQAVDFYTLAEDNANEPVYQALQVIDYVCAKYENRVDSFKISKFTLMVFIDDELYCTSLVGDEEN